MQLRAKHVAGGAITLIVIVSLAILAQSAAGQHVLKRLGIVGHPPSFTELSFDQPLELPSTLTQKPHPVAIAFTIANHSSRTASYEWKIVATASARQTLRSGFVQLAAGQRVSVVPQLELGCVTRTRVNVVLSSGENIGFWTTCVRRGHLRHQ